jgi:hypothetical protein
MQIRIIPNDKGNPPGKLADAELHFEPTDGVLSGLKLIGFGVWERRGSREKLVTFPARSYSVNGERRSFSLLRPSDSGLTLPDVGLGIKQAIIDAYLTYENGLDIK